jgi:hypothetical protein
MRLRLRSRLLAYAQGPRERTNRPYQQFSEAVGERTRREISLRLLVFMGFILAAYRLRGRCQKSIRKNLLSVSRADQQIAGVLLPDTHHSPAGPQAALDLAAAAIFSSFSAG